MSLTKNPWIRHVSTYRQRHPSLSYKDCLKAASQSYRSSESFHITPSQTMMKKRRRHVVVDDDDDEPVKEPVTMLAPSHFSLIDDYVGGAFMGCYGPVIGSDSSDANIWSDNGCDAQRLKNLEAVLRTLPEVQNVKLYRGAYAPKGIERKQKPFDIDMPYVFSTSTSRRVAFNWARTQLSKAKNLVPCVYVINITRAHGLDLVKATQFVRSSAHKAAVLLQDEVILASGRLTNVTYKGQCISGRGQNKTLVYECECTFVDSLL